MLTIRNLWKTYESGPAATPVVRGIDLEVEEGEFFTLLGPSGCGKTTTLRCVAGLETPERGEIVLGGTPVFSSVSGAFVPVNRRDIAMVFQSYAVWPHMSVFENVSFPLEALGVDRRERERRTSEALALVGLERFARRSATQLSGGQQQRVALARAIVKGARLLLLDEPLSNLDAKLREHMRAELRQLQQQIGVTAVYVTHDQDEALALSDRVAVMQRGEIVALGQPMALYLRPPNGFTARFLGSANVLPCTVQRANGTADVLARTPLGDLLAQADAEVRPGDAAEVLVRPEHVELRPPRGGQDGPAPPNTLSGVVASRSFSGRIVEYAVRTAPGPTLRVQALSASPLAEGASVLLHLPASHCRILPAEDAEAEPAVPA